MLKKTISFEDFDENPATETLYFNITKTEISEHLDLINEFEKLKKLFDGDERVLVMAEVQIILDFVKILMKLSYGIRSEDGKSFSKSDEIWTKFTQTAAYDAFTFSLFENPEEANAFMIGIFPKNLLEMAKAQIETDPAVSGTVNLPTEASVTPILPPTRKELTSMSREELIEAMKTKEAELKKSE